MGYFVYIIQSDFDGSFYKGYSENPIDRLAQHNAGMSRYTSSKKPWSFVYLEQLSSKRAALVREKVLKKYSHVQINILIRSPKNLLKV